MDNRNIDEVSKIIFETNNKVNELEKKIKKSDIKEYHKVKNDILKFKFSLSNLIYSMSKD